MIGCWGDVPKQRMKNNKNKRREKRIKILVEELIVGVIVVVVVKLKLGEIKIEKGVKLLGEVEDAAAFIAEHEKYNDIEQQWFR